MAKDGDDAGSEHVWIVCHDERPDNTVLGVFRTAEQAEDYAAEIGHMYDNGVIYSSFPIGYRHIDETHRFFTYLPPATISE